MNLIRLGLLPFSWIFGYLTSFRRWIYDFGLIQRKTTPVPSIIVGNLRVGGTGKTPLSIYLYDRLEGIGNCPAILSRGYGRSTKGFFSVNPDSTLTEVGDEAIQYLELLGSEASIHVCENRIQGVKKILEKKVKTDLVILDDGFQHLQIKPALSVLLTSFHDPFIFDYPLPYGRLRERRINARNADIIVVSKCPRHLTLDEADHLTQNIKRYAPQSEILCSTLEYQEPLTFGKDQGPVGPQIVLVTGIADSQPLVDYLSEQYKLLNHFKFMDHHAYSSQDVDGIVSYCLENNASLMTTGKDMVKLKNFRKLNSIPSFYQPMSIGFLFDGESALITKLLEKLNG